MSGMQLPLTLHVQGPDPRLLAAIDALDVVGTQRRILRRLAIRDHSTRELELELELTHATVRHHLAELQRQYRVSDLGPRWGLAADWIRQLGIGDGRPACVPT